MTRSVASATGLPASHIRAADSTDRCRAVPPPAGASRASRAPSASRCTPRAASALPSGRPVGGGNGSPGPGMPSDRRAGAGIRGPMTSEVTSAATSPELTVRSRPAR